MQFWIKNNEFQKSNLVKNNKKPQAFSNSWSAVHKPDNHWAMMIYKPSWSIQKLLKKKNSIPSYDLVHVSQKVWFLI